ncbi:MAG: hypothetical protein PF448_13125 [Bacteroidales bacterium]|jgi:hypothetical protein|nr:hypothetical protein [Bacteroidales bacterium]
MIKAFVRNLFDQLFYTDHGDTVISLFGGISGSVLVSNTFFTNLAISCVTWLVAGIFGALGALLTKHIVKSVIQSAKNRRNEK